MKIGKRGSGGKTNFKFEDGDNVYRILPPLGNNADAEIWCQYYPVVWGYKGTDDKMKPFVDASEKNLSNGKWETMSAALRRSEELKIKQQQMKDAGATKDQMKQIGDIVMRFNIEKKYHVNAINLKGEIGVLKIGYKAYKQLVGDKKSDDPGILALLKNKEIDPTTHLTGAYINFKRTGKGRDTQYTVTPYMEEQQDGSLRVKLHEIDDAVKNQLSSLGPARLDLTTLYPTPTLEEIEEIVSGGPEVVDRILKNSDSDSSSESQETQESASTEQSAPAVDPAAALKDLEAMGIKPEESSSKSEEKQPTLDDLKASAGVAPETKAADGATTEQKAPEPTTTAPAQNAAEMDPNDFLKSLGVENV